ncbi:hypothetical protein F5148DRAFT_916297 [Russula earlei]|uniref:Uncharacterized protein n=1 Tax=Russula earlei TaxID=71964 RepID=A0ACC0U9V9_9AGAM|nr:hypothetical protein F5148DRAFT_916297 [Russula earlei]
MPGDSISLDDQDWEVIADHWWHTPLSLAPCPLSWVDHEPCQFRQPRPPEVAAKKAHYWHERLLLVAKNAQRSSVCCQNCQEWLYLGGGGMFVCDAMKGVGVQGEMELNLDLVGVKMVLAMVDQLEHAVGITTTDHHTAEDIAILARRVSLMLNDVLPIAYPEGSWDEYTAKFLDGSRIAPHSAVIFRPDLNSDPPPADSITSILDLDLDPPRRKLPRFSREIIDLTDSEQSVASEAPPATPKPLPSFAASGSDGTMSGDLPKFHLPRVPSSPSISYSSTSPLTSDGLSSESSHTRCSSLPPGGDLHKEDYDVEVVSESTPSEESEIPLFLVTSSDRLIRQSSRTREIIDRLRFPAVPRGRSKTSNARGNSNASMPVKNSRSGLNDATVKQLFQKGSDGWICLADDAEYATATSKAKDPSQPGQADGPQSRNPIEHSGPSELEEAILSPRPPKSTRDPRRKQTQSKHVRRGSGWVEGLPPSSTPTAFDGPPRGALGHRLTPSVQPAAPASVGTFTFPPPAYYAFPSAPIPQYASMAPFGPPPYRGYPPGAGYPHPLTMPPYPGMLPHQHQHQHQHQQPYPHLFMYQQHRAAGANPPVITGSTGIRHAQW